MIIAFLVGGTTGSFERHSTTGRAVLRFGGEAVTLQSPWDPRTHFSFATTGTWQARLGDHGFTMIERRARMFGGVREASYEVCADGEQVDRRNGC